MPYLKQNEVLKSMVWQSTSRNTHSHHDWLLILKQRPNAKKDRRHQPLTAAGLGGVRASAGPEMRTNPVLVTYVTSARPRRTWYRGLVRSLRFMSPDEDEISGGTGRSDPLEEDERSEASYEERRRTAYTEPPSSVHQSMS